jgi:predicted transcriptional regulator
MKEEDIDWIIYHLLVQVKTASPDELAAQSGLDLSLVILSLQRLEHNLLVKFADDRARVLNISEMLILCQMKYDTNLLYTIENGVIKPKKKE